VVKLAVTVLAALSASVHVVVVPEQSPLQPTNLAPGFALALRTTLAPGA
jgi:hypothetical protein